MESEVPTTGSDDRRTAYSPLVRRLAEEFDVDLDAVRGTGPGGRVTRADVQQAAFGPNLNLDEPMESATLLSEEAISDEPTPATDTTAADTTAADTVPTPAPAEPEQADPVSDNTESDESEQPALLADEQPTAVESAIEHATLEPGDEHIENPADAASEPTPEDQDQVHTASTSPTAAQSFTLFADVDASALLRANERLGQDRDAPAPLEALVVRLVAPAAELWPSVNARMADDYAPSDTINVSLRTPGRTWLIPDAGRASLIDLGELFDADEAAGEYGAGPTDADGPEATTIAVDYLLETEVRAAAPSLWAGTASTIAIGHPRDELSAGSGRPRPVPTITIALTCTGAVDMEAAVGFLTEVITNLEDPILVFAD